MMEPSGPWTWTAFQKWAKQVVLQISQMLLNETKFFPGQLAWGEEELERASISLSAHWVLTGRHFSCSQEPFLDSPAVLDVYHFVHPKAALPTSTFLIVAALLIDDTTFSTNRLIYVTALILSMSMVSPSYEMQMSKAEKAHPPRLTS